MFMWGWFLMNMTIVFAYAIGSQAIRHQVMGLSGICKDVRASDICCVLASLLMSLVRDTLTVGSPAISMYHTLYM